MKTRQHISSLGMAFTYAGCFFGAGYVSGQELWQFFGAYGSKGLVGIIVSTALFFLFGVMLMFIAKNSKKISFEDVIIPVKNKTVKNIFSYIVIFFMLGIFVIMSAGAGALVNQIFGLPAYIGSFAFCILLYIFSLNGVSGAIKVFTILIPILVITTIIICIFTLKKYGISCPVEPQNTNILLGGFFLSSITYVSFNMIASIGTLIPVGRFIKRKRTIFIGIAIGCFLMFIVALGIVLSLNTAISSINAELPMLEVAFKLSDVFGYIYSALLIIGMLGTSIASVVAISEFFMVKNDAFITHKNTFILVLTILGFVLSLFGFGNLVGTVYPIFGYAGYAVLILIIFNFVRNIIKRK